MAKKVAFLYGFGEGNWHGKQMVPALRAANFEIVDAIADADIIFAHSAGCFFTSDYRQGQLLVIVGPPYWPGKPLAWCFLQKAYLDLKDCIQNGYKWFWVRKTFWNSVYIGADILRTLAIYRYARKQNFYEALQKHDVMLIRNEADAFCTPDIEKLPTNGRPFIYYHLPGQHDDCWLHPERYANLLQSGL